jgi:hypothetical protein
MDEKDVVKISKEDLNLLWKIMDKLENPKVTYQPNLKNMKDEVIEQSKDQAEIMYNILSKYMEE